VLVNGPMNVYPSKKLSTYFALKYVFVINIPGLELDINQILITIV
jgi:hypothetical protein